MAGKIDLAKISENLVVNDEFKLFLFIKTQIKLYYSNIINS